ncbi:MAG: hypothetical protein JKY48_08150 [Flavobacteriales bacterium]|nr:hypothetical protein [Flavobacteriales bacterium]
MSSGITELLASGQLARLIPTVADSKREERATSSLLASFMVVPAFARDVLSSAGAPVGKRLKIVCYTEVTFKEPKEGKKPRPDGLVVISNGSKYWTALVESKIGNAELTTEQVEEYLDLAKQNGINALITISNQFATTPTHHPVKVAKNKVRSVELYHFSWLSLKSKAVLLTGNKGIDDPEQAFILSELVRYLDHDSSGVSSMTKMPSCWKDVCHSVQQGAALNRNAELVKQSVSGWHQLLRHLALNLSMAIGQPVKIALSRAREKNAELNFAEDCNHFAKESNLCAEFDIPNAASKLIFSADCIRRTINISMKLEAPKDKSKATASINWITRQLKGMELTSVSVRAYWPNRIPMTAAPLVETIENPSILIPPGVKTLPTYLEVIRVVDLSGRFKGAKTFVEDSSREFPSYYQDVGQHLLKWVAKAPKVKDFAPTEPSIPTIFSQINEIAANGDSSVTVKPEQIMPGTIKQSDDGETLKQEYPSPFFTDKDRH